MALIKVTRSVYKATVRAAARLDSLPPEELGIILGHRTELPKSSASRAQSSTTSTITGSSGVRSQSLASRVKAAYKDTSQHNFEPHSRLDAALAALSELNKAAALLDTSGEGSPRAHAAPFVRHRVGDSVEVLAGAGASPAMAIAGTSIGYRRGVVVGWDPVCQAGEGYLKATPAPSTRAQPHYHVLLDSSQEMLTKALADQQKQQAGGSSPGQEEEGSTATARRRAGSNGRAKVREQDTEDMEEETSLPNLRAMSNVAYVAQECVRPAAGRPCDRLVLHPHLHRFFTRFDMSTGAYEMAPQLEAAYPLDSYAAFPLPARILRKLHGASSKAAGGTEGMGSRGAASAGMATSVLALPLAKPWVPSKAKGGSPW